MVTQLAEKALKHRTKQFCFFFDLKKVYNSVPRDALWLVMRKSGVPEVLIDIVKSFHERLEAEIRVGDNMLDAFEVKNGPRQGCTMAPTLFNLYACEVTEKWLEKVKNVERAGTHTLYRLDKQLFRRSTKGACMECFRECQFADCCFVGNYM